MSLPEKCSKHDWRKHLHNIVRHISPSQHAVLGDGDHLDDQPPVPESAAASTSGQAPTPSPSRPSGKRAATAGVPLSSEPKKKRARRAHKTDGDEYLKGLAVANTKIDKIQWFETTIQLGSVDRIRQALTPEVTAEIIYELTINNFQLDLLSLDQALAPHKWPAASDVSGVEIREAVEARMARELDVRRVFPLATGQQIPSLVLVEIPNVDRGLMAWDWYERHPYLLKLRALMLEWEGCPTAIRTMATASTPGITEKMESALAGFYCQAFVSTFGRAAIIPCRLPYRARMREFPAKSFGSVECECSQVLSTDRLLSSF